MEYAKGGELFNYIVKKKRLSEQEASFFYNQIIFGLEFIHKNLIVHRDLKPENLLLTPKNELKIIDFGLSNKYNKNQLLSTPCGSPCYAAPEMILGRKYEGIMIDLWSTGIILYAMVCGYLPFEDKNNDKLYKKILNCKYELPDKLSSSCKDLIKKLLTVNPKKRIRLEEVKRHSFMKLAFDNIYHSNSTIIHINQGINIDMEVIEKMESMSLGYSKEDILSNLQNTNHNGITTTYELLLKQKRENSNTNINPIANNNKIIALPFDLKKDQVTVNVKKDQKKLKKGKRDLSVTIGYKTNNNYQTNLRDSISKERDNSLDMMKVINQCNRDTNIIMPSPPGLTPLNKKLIQRQLPKKRQINNHSPSPLRNIKIHPPLTSKQHYFVKAIDTSVTYDSNIDSKKKSNKIIYIPSNTINLMEDDLKITKQIESTNVVSNSSNQIHVDISLPLASGFVSAKNYHRSYSQNQRDKKRIRTCLTPIDELSPSFLERKSFHLNSTKKIETKMPSIKNKALASSDMALLPSFDNNSNNKTPSVKNQSKINKKLSILTSKEFSSVNVNPNEKSITIINTNHTINNFYLAPFDTSGYNSITSRTPTNQHNAQTYQNGKAKNSSKFDRRKTNSHSKAKTKNISGSSQTSDVVIQTEPRTYSPMLYSMKIKQMNKRTLVKKPAVVDIDITTNDKATKTELPTTNVSNGSIQENIDKKTKQYQYTNPNLNSNINAIHPSSKKTSKKPSSITLKQSLITPKRTNAQHIHGFVDLSSKDVMKKKESTMLTNPTKKFSKSIINKNKQKTPETIQLNTDSLALAQTKSFATCTTSSSSLEIEEKILSICKESGFNVNKKEKEDLLQFICTNTNENIINIELIKIEVKSVLKLYHTKGNEQMTKDIIKKIIVAIDF